MDTSRRGFLQLAGLVMASSALPAWAKASTPLGFTGPTRTHNPNSWPILQGPTDAFSTSLILMHDVSANFVPRITGPQKETVAFTFVDRWSLPTSTLVSSEIFVNGLLPGFDYELELVNGNGEVFDRRQFGTLDTARSDCRFAVVSCMNDGSLMGNKVFTMWEALERENCDFVIFLGDTCYADFGNKARDEAGYARRYAETRHALGWFRQPRLKPAFATWDDHDFGHNDADRTFPIADFTRQMFRKFWGSLPGQSWRRSQGVGSVLEAFGQRFFLMDDRSFRDPSGPGARHWGLEQTDWLIGELDRSTQPAWIMNGSQFFGGYLTKESYEYNHPEDFRQLLHRLSLVAAPVAFVSGDVHFSEIMQIEPSLLGYPTYEFTSSSMHSYTFPQHQNRAKNPRRLVSEWRHNFMVFDTTTAGGWNISARCVTEGNALSYAKSVAIKR